MRDINSIRQLQRSSISECLTKNMIIASEYQIKLLKKQMDIVFQKNFNCVHVDNGVHLNARDILEWFVRIERHQLRAAGDMSCTMKICITGDGIRIGPINFHLNYIRSLKTQVAGDYFVIAVNIGADNKENSDKYVLPLIKEIERLCKEKFIVDGEEWELIFLLPGDMKEQWAMAHEGSGNSCFFCTSTLRNGEHCKLRPACDNCKKDHPDLKFCRHFPDLDRIRPVLDFHRVEWPDKNTKAEPLLKFAETLNTVQVYDAAGKKLTKDVIWTNTERWIRTKRVMLGTFYADNELNIVNATEQLIEMNLRLRYHDETDYDDVIGANASIEIKREKLLHCLLMEEKLDYIDKFDGTGIDDVKALVMDILHCKVRVKNSLLTQLCHSLMARPELINAEKLRRLTLVNAILQNVYKSAIGCPSNIKIELNKNNKVEVTTINGDKLDKLTERVMDDILNVMYVDDNEKNTPLVTIDGVKSNVTYHKWKSVFFYFDVVMDILRQHKKLSSQEFSTLSDTIDLLGTLYIEMFSYAKIGNYMHYLITGHVTNMLRNCDFNISDLQQQGCEAKNKDVNLHFRHQSSKGGGKNAVHPCLDTLRSFGRTWLRKIDEIRPGWLHDQMSLITREEKSNWRMHCLLECCDNNNDNITS